MTACVSIVIYSNITNCTVCSTMYHLSLIHI